MTTTVPIPIPTPVETFEDILEVMERNPRLRQAMRYHVLDDQYRELPAVVAQLAANIQNLTDVVQTLAERQDRLEAAMAELATTFAGVVERQARLETAMAKMETAMAELAAAVATIAQRQDVLDRRVNVMHGDVGQLAGKDYESFVNKGIAIRMRTHLRLRRPRLIHETGNAADSHGLNEILELPLDDDIITPDEALEILRSDFVVAGTGEGRVVYALGETSRTLRRDDFTRAQERASLLAKATGYATFAFAIGSDEPAPEHRQLAERLGVTIIIAPEPDTAAASE